MAAKSSQFLKITDQSGKLVEGECIDDEHYNQIDVTDWNWNLVDPSAAKDKSTARARTGASGGATARSASSDSSGTAGDRITPSRFGFSKRTDKSTVRLLAAMDKGEIFPEVELAIEEEYQEQPDYVPFRMNIVLTDAFVTSVDWSVTAAEARVDMEEKWELNYDRIKISYLYRGKDGKGWIDVAFTGPTEQDAGGIAKSPPSSAETKVADKRKFEDFLKSSGWTPPGKR